MYSKFQINSSVLLPIESKVSRGKLTIALVYDVYFQYCKLPIIRGIGWNVNQELQILRLICIVAENKQSLAHKYV